MRHTCGDCPHVKSQTMLEEYPVYFCGKTDTLVPLKGTKALTVFHRIPLDCPLPDTEVHKSESSAVQSLWVTVTHKKTPR